MDITHVEAILMLFQSEPKQIEKKVQPDTAIICEEKLNQGIKSGLYYLDSACFDLLRSEKLAISLENEEVVILGYKRAILLRKKGQSLVSIIAGDNTLLDDSSLRSIALSPSTNYFASLTDKSVLIFEKTIEGNVSPNKLFSIDRKISAKSVAINFKESSIQIKDSSGNVIEKLDFKIP